eukprot:759967-Hanusia_phi.AAC.1
MFDFVDVERYKKAEQASDAEVQADSSPLSPHHIPTGAAQGARRLRLCPRLDHSQASPVRARQDGEYPSCVEEKVTSAVAQGERDQLKLRPHDQACGGRHMRRRDARRGRDEGEKAGSGEKRKRSESFELRSSNSFQGFKRPYPFVSLLLADLLVLPFASSNRLIARWTISLETPCLLSAISKWISPSPPFRASQVQAQQIDQATRRSPSSTRPPAACPSLSPLPSLAHLLP